MNKKIISTALLLCFLSVSGIRGRKYGTNTENNLSGKTCDRSFETEEERIEDVDIDLRAMKEVAHEIDKHAKHEKSKSDGKMESEYDGKDDSDNEYKEPEKLKNENSDNIKDKKRAELTPKQIKRMIIRLREISNENFAGLVKDVHPKLRRKFRHTTRELKTSIKVFCDYLGKSLKFDRNSETLFKIIVEVVKKLVKIVFQLGMYSMDTASDEYHHVTHKIARVCNKIANALREVTWEKN